MALSDIRSDVQANWPDNYHSSDLDNDKTDEFINLAQKWVCRLHNFTWMGMEVYRSTVDDQRRYALPTAGDTDWTDVAAGTVRKFKAEMENGAELIDADSYRKPLTKWYKSDLKDSRKFRDTAAAGRPTHYCIEEENIELWKLPDHSFNSDTAWSLYLEYYGYLADLSATNTSNALTTQWPEVLEYYATALGFRFGLDYEEADKWEARAKEILAQMISEDNNKKLATIEDGMAPEFGQSLGGNRRIYDTDDLKAHYE